MNQPHLWWYVTRASALVAWVLLTGSVMLGIFLSTRVMRKIDNPAWLQDLHRFMSGLALVMVGLHMVSLMLDDYAHFSLGQLLIPGATANSDVASIQAKTIPVALGVVALYLMVAVQASSWFMKRLPRRFWKGIHYASYVALIFVVFHAGFSGSDVKELWYQTMSVALIALTTAAVILRVTVGTKTRPARRAAGTATLPAGDARRESTSGATTRTSRTRGRDSEAAAPLPPVPKIRMRVTDRRTLAKDVVGITLVPVAGGKIDVWPPGSHVTLYLPDGLERQYSLCSDPADRDHIDIAVLRRRGTQGGSDWIHRNLKVGSEIDVSPPRNHFDLEPAPRYVFVAGGIGITPIKAMIESLPPQREWDLFYFGRSRKTMAFVAELERVFGTRVHVVASDESRGEFDLASLVTDQPVEVYSCGPESLMSAVAALVDPDHVHLERFVARERPDREARPVTLHLRRSKKTIAVASNESLLEAMERSGVPILGSCRNGLCGTCEVRVVSGDVEHRDSIMDDDEKDDMHIMYPCVSRANTPELTLDI